MSIDGLPDSVQLSHIPGMFASDPREDDRSDELFEVTRIIN